MANELEVAATDIAANLDERKPVPVEAASETKFLGLSLQHGELTMRVLVAGRITFLSCNATECKLRNEHGKEMSAEANAVMCKVHEMLDEVGAFVVANLFAGG